MSLSLPPSSRRIDPRRRDSNADGKGQARPAGCETNGNLCRAHGNGVRPSSATTVHDHPGVRACPPGGRGWAVPAILRIRLGCQPSGGDGARALLRSALGYERVLSEADVEQYTTTAGVRLRP